MGSSASDVWQAHALRDPRSGPVRRSKSTQENRSRIPTSIPPNRPSRESPGCPVATARSRPVSAARQVWYRCVINKRRNQERAGRPVATSQVRDRAVLSIGSIRRRTASVGAPSGIRKPFRLRAQASRSHRPFSHRPRHPAQRQVDSPAPGEQRRGPRDNAIDAVKGEPGSPTQHQRIA
jgi:hypothetical protein